MNTGPEALKDDAASAKVLEMAVANANLLNGIYPEQISHVLLSC